MTEKFLLRTFIRWGKRDVMYGFGKVSRVGNFTGPLGITNFINPVKKFLTVLLFPTKNRWHYKERFKSKIALNTYINIIPRTFYHPPILKVRRILLKLNFLTDTHTHLQLPPFERKNGPTFLSLEKPILWIAHPAPVFHHCVMLRILPVHTKSIV